MEIEAEVRVRYQQATSAGEDPAVQVDIEGEDLGMLIGKRGETIAALQYIARLIMARKLDRWVNLNMDVGGYKKHREQQLRRLAQRMAQQVHQFGRPISLEPMPANERRIIHITLQDRAGVTTESSGEGDRRRVTIQPDLRR
jgi:spoIIIJ-associated protein